MRPVLILCSMVFIGCNCNSEAMEPDGSVKLDGSVGCPMRSDQGTLHNATVTGEVVWRADDSPHRVTSGFRVEGTLTIEPCSTVLLSDGASIDVGSSSTRGASLIAQGTAARPIRFTHVNSGERWGAITVYAGNTATFESVTMEYGGDVDAVFSFGGTLVLRGPNDGTLERLASVKDVTIDHSGGVGVALREGSGFGLGSAGLTVRNAGEQAMGAAETWQYPVLFEPPGVGTLPTGSYSGQRNEIWVRRPSQTVEADEQFHARGVPYRMEGGLYVRSKVAGSPVTFTIDPGVTLAFTKDSELTLGDGTKSVTLALNGTAAAPITLTSAEPTGAAGDWVGLLLFGSPPAGNVMSNVTVEYAGGESGTRGFGCGALDNDGAVLIIGWRPDDVFISSSTIRFSAGEGIVSGWESDSDGPNLRGTNTFTSIAGPCAVSRWRNATGLACPNRTDAAPLCL